MDLSVVIASIESARSIESCLVHLGRSCAGLRAEFIVADASRDDSAARAEAQGATAVIRCRPGTLAPHLWAEGYRRTTGRVVAFTTGHCLVSPPWAEALIAAINAGAAGAGGPLVIAPGTGPTDWAVFYLRYSGFMAHTLGTGRTSDEVAGDNAAYARTGLDAHAASFGDGFWEIDFHRRLRSEGGRLAMVPAATVDFSRSFPFRAILQHRFAHGRHFGAGRVKSGARRSWQVVSSAPLVPLVLAGRAGARAVRGSAPWRFAVALPWFLVLAGAWAAGEARGALHPDTAVDGSEPRNGGGR